MIAQRVESIKTKFSDLLFEEMRHLYHVGDAPLISVSKIVESYAPKFDAERQLPFSARKEKTTVDELREKWVKTNKDACDLGHRTHDFLEQYNGLQYPNTPWEQAGVQFIKDYGGEYEIVFRELRMYSKEYWYAGTMDLLLMHKVTKKLLVADWKTNKDLFKCYKGETLFPPFNTMENTPYNKYQIQLSLYQMMLEEAGEDISDRILVYLKADGTYQVYHTFDLIPWLKIEMNKRLLN